MRKCDTCGRKFRLLANNRYEIVKRPIGLLNCLSQGLVYYNVFNCPHCGCQNIVSIVEKGDVKDIENGSVKKVTNAEEAKEYQISENIQKGFEEFTKIMFKQGQVEGEKKE
jgi:transcription elongation factor Elf1